MANRVEIREKGVSSLVPAVEINGRTVIVKGRWLKTAAIHDEQLVEGTVIKDPDQFVAFLRNNESRPDVFTFSQRPPDVAPRYRFAFHLDNMAAVSITTFEDWWDKLPQESRKNVRRAGKRGVEAKIVSFDDELMCGVKKLCDETPVRQGRPFWHYQKDLETLKHEHSTYLARSEFIGAYFEGNLIGSVRLIYVDQMALVMHILAMNAHYDKRPMNALLAKCVQVCVEKRMRYLVYGNYFYGSKNSSLMEFKRRNGFKRIDFPQYYVPLTFKGKIYVTFRAYRGVNGLLPSRVLDLLSGLRNRYYEMKKKPLLRNDGSVKDF